MRTITLTDRPPVTIIDDKWPRLATASYYDHDGEHECQANSHWNGHVSVRRHADGRSIVYAKCSYDTAWQGSPNYEQRSGELLTADTDIDKLIATIHRVHESIDIVDDDHADLWRLLAAECIADLPAETLD